MKFLLLCTIILITPGLVIAASVTPAPAAVRDQQATIDHHVTRLGNPRVAPEESSKGQTALYQATVAGDLPTVKKLLTGDIDSLQFSLVIIDDRCYYEAPVHAAARLGHYAILQYLIDYDANNINVGDDDENTPLHIAAVTGHKEIVAYLLAIGANRTLYNIVSLLAEELVKDTAILAVFNKGKLLHEAVETPRAMRHEKLHELTSIAQRYKENANTQPAYILNPKLLGTCDVAELDQLATYIPNPKYLQFNANTADLKPSQSGRVTRIGNLTSGSDHTKHNERCCVIC